MDSRFPHLPAGREPGRQTRSQHRFRRLAVVTSLVLAAFFLGLAASGAADPGVAEPWVFFAVFGPLALACLGFAAFLMRRRRPRQARHLAVEVTPHEVPRGGVVDARVDVGDPAKVSGRLEVGLVCVERYDVEETADTGDGPVSFRTTHEHDAYEEWRPVDARQQVRFTIPPDAPYSYEGACLSLAWAVRVRERRDGQPDARRDAPLWVTP